MNCRECQAIMEDLIAGALTTDQRRALDAHVKHCPTCTAELAARTRLHTAVAALPREVQPVRDLWPQIERDLERTPAVHTAPLPRWHRGVALVAAAAVVAAGVGLFWMQRTPAPGWAVAAISGSPRIGSRAIADRGQWRVGEWLETDALSRARLAVGDIGEVDLEPNSRLRFLQASATDHRIELARGTMSALIWAPPRLFFVETPSATAIDLGCAYTLNVADDGTGELHVTAGYVALQHHGRESIIPAGMVCLTRPDAPPGTPFVANASPEWREALARFDFEHGGSTALGVVLADSRHADPITLWHLLGRTDGADRAAVYDALMALHPPPTGVERGAVLSGDATALGRWATELGLASLLTTDVDP